MITRTARILAVTALVVAAGFFMSCTAQNSSSGDMELMMDFQPLPPWVLDMIETLSSQPVADPPAYIARYWYRNQTVYFIPEKCCDQSSTLYDVNGVVLCHPDGGQSGVGDGKCTDFFEMREHEEIVWQDDRQASGNSNAPEFLFLALATLQFIHITLMN